jgi:hypothetical protein
MSLARDEKNDRAHDLDRIDADEEGQEPLRPAH